MTAKLPVLAVRPDQQGIIRFQNEDGDTVDILAGMRAAEIVRRCNAFPDLIAFVREVAAIDPKAGGGNAKYFVTADFVARARALAHP